MNDLSVLPGLAFPALVHLLVIGTLVRLAVAAVLNSTASSRPASVHPRARYAVAVLGFVAAAVLPLAVQIAGLRHSPGTEAVTATASALSQAASEMGRVLWTAWWIGGLALAGRAAFGWLRFQRQCRRWVGAPGALRRTLDWPADVALFTGPDGTPLATGLLRPRVYLPGWSVTDLGPTALARIARHELAHARWRDPLVDRGVRIVRGLLWPAWPLWSLERLIRREREAAADREALLPEREPSPIDYAETLLAVAARRGGLVALVGAGGELEERVRRLLRPPGRPSFRARALPAALVLFGTAVLLAVPLPAGNVAARDAYGEDTRSWGPLDHFLGYNPTVEVVVAPGVHRVRIQGHELDSEEIERWERSFSLEEKAAIVHEAEELARRARSPD